MIKSVIGSHVESFAAFYTNRDIQETWKRDTTHMLLKPLQIAPDNYRLSFSNFIPIASSLCPSLRTPETYISSIDLEVVRAGSLVRQSERLLTFRSGVQIPLGPL